MKPRNTHRWVALAAAGLLLSGCGLSDPGTAARVGEQKISVSEVQRFTDGVCAFNAPAVATGQAQAVPLAAQKQSVVQALAQGAVAEQAAEAQGVDVPGEVTQYLLAQVRPQLEQIDDEGDREAATEFYTDVAQGLTAAAAIAADGAGAQLGPDNLDQFLTQGQQELLPRLAADADVTVDPRYGLDDDLSIDDADASVSQPVSDLAVQLSGGGGQDAAPSAASLPPDQRCGG